MISVYLLLDLFPFPSLCPCLCLCLFLPPAPDTSPAPDSGPAPPPVRFPCPALPGDGMGQKCSPGVRRGTVGRRNGAEMSPERVVMPRWATEWGRSVPQACGAAPLGYGNGRKCSPGVRRGAVRRRIVAEMFPERAAWPNWATEGGEAVARACLETL